MTITWRPEIGDPTVVGWATVVAYFAAALACGAAARRIGAARGYKSERRLWVALAALLAALGFNKQLDLQMFFTQVARGLAREEGWYNLRHTYEGLLLGTIATVCAIGIAVIFARLQTRSRAAQVAVAGAGIIVTFVMLRATSMHHFDAFIGSRVGGWKMNWLIELSGIAITGFAAMQQITASITRDIRTDDGRHIET